MRSASSWNELRLVVNEPPEGHSSDHLFLSAFTELASSIVVQTPSGISSVRYQQYAKEVTKIPRRFSPEAKRKITYFFDVDAWLEHCYSCHAVIGHRMHANMVGLQAGTPSLLIVHDARLQGLADTMCIPVITEAQAYAIATSAPSLFADIFEAQVHSYLARRDELLDSFLALFESVPNVDSIPR
jgi:polysaccharide pyruvyl transferase WcaK-like protein